MHLELSSNCEYTHHFLYYHECSSVQQSSLINSLILRLLRIYCITTAEEKPGIKLKFSTYNTMYNCKVLATFPFTGPKRQSQEEIWWCQEAFGICYVFQHKWDYNSCTSGSCSHYHILGTPFCIWCISDSAVATALANICLWQCFNFVAIYYMSYYVHCMPCMCSCP